MEEPSPISIEQISEADWEKTPASVKQLVRVLMERVTQLEKRLAELEADNQQLRSPSQPQLQELLDSAFPRFATRIQTQEKHYKQ